MQEIASAEDDESCPLPDSESEQQILMLQHEVVLLQQQLTDAVDALTTSQAAEASLNKNLELATATIAQLQAQLVKSNHTVEVMLQDR